MRSTAMRSITMRSTTGACPVVLIDSCVWHHSFSRNVLRHLALALAVRIRWSRAIEVEWLASVMRARPEIARATLISVRDRFRLEFPDGLAPEPPPHQQVPRLPDPGDEHVLRAALMTNASIICTVDRGGFPNEILGPLGIRPMTPSALLADCVRQRESQTAVALQTHRVALRNPAFDPHAYLAALTRAGLIENHETAMRVAVSLRIGAK